MGVCIIYGKTLEGLLTQNSGMFFNEVAVLVSVNQFHLFFNLLVIKK